MTNYYRIDVEDIDEGIQEYNSLDELLKETTYFYHDTFADEEGYDENKEYTNLQSALELWEGNGYCIAEELSTGVETSSYKFEIFQEKGTVVQVNSKLYKEMAIGDEDMNLPYKHYSPYNMQFLLENENVELTDEEKSLLQDCKMLLENHTVDFIEFEEL